MKKIKKIELVLTLVMILFSCEKPKDPAGQRNVGVIPVISDVNPGIFDSKDLQNSYVEFVIDLVPGTNIDNVTIIGSSFPSLESIPQYQRLPQHEQYEL